MKHIKRIVVMVVGATVLTLGIALVVLPGPAFNVIPLGLAILVIEFAWAWPCQQNAGCWLERNKSAIQCKEVL